MASRRTASACQALPGVRTCAMGFTALSLPGLMWFLAVDMHSDFSELSGWLQRDAEQRSTCRGPGMPEAQPPGGPLWKRGGQSLPQPCPAAQPREAACTFLGIFLLGPSGGSRPKWFLFLLFQNKLSVSPTR